MNVTVYTTPTCHMCMQLKEFLKENNVEFENVDVSQNREAAKELVQKTGYAGVPVVEVDGEFIVGYDEDKLKEALNI